MTRKKQDVYKRQAEAYAQKGESGAAWDDLSHLRENRYKEYSEIAITDATVLLLSLIHI